jgi:polysaccharide biosynthesis protein PslG
MKLKLTMLIFVAVTACAQSTSLQSKPTNFSPIANTQTTTIDDFEDQNALSKWTLIKVPAVGPWAQGSHSIVPGVNNSRGLEINYSLSTEQWQTGKNGDSIWVERKLEPAIEAQAISFWVDSDTNVSIQLRVEDSAGQFFAYTDLSTQVQRSDSYYRAFVPLESHQNHWGGPNDGVVRSPVKTVQIIVGGPRSIPGNGAVFAGRVRIDDLVAWKAIPSSFGLESKNAPLESVPSSYAKLKPRLGIVGYPDVWTQNAAENDAVKLDWTKKLGFSFIRADLGWVHIEKNGQYDFSKYDAYFDAAEQRGLGLLWILGYGHPDHSPSTEFPLTPMREEDFAAYGRYVQAAVSRYKGRNVRYEIWNEPDGFWESNPNETGTGDPNTTHRPAAYAKLAKIAIAAAKAADPNVVVSSGGLTAGKYIHNYLNAMLKEPAFQQVSAMAIHFYDIMPERNAAHIQRFKTRANEVTPGMPVWDTEWGFASDKPANQFEPYNGAVGDLNLHGAYTLRRILVAWLSGLPVTTVFKLEDDQPNETTALETYGLLTNDLREKPAGTTIRILSEIASTRNFTGMVKGLPPGVNAMQLEGVTDRVQVLWAETKSAKLETRVPCGVTVSDLLGVGVTLTTCTGENGYQAFTLEEAKGPVYVFSNK